MDFVEEGSDRGVGLGAERNQGRGRFDRGAFGAVAAERDAASHAIGEAADVAFAFGLVAAVVDGDVGAVRAVEVVRMRLGLGAHHVNPGPAVGAVAVGDQVVHRSERGLDAGMPFGGADLGVLARAADRDVHKAGLDQAD